MANGLKSYTKKGIRNMIREYKENIVLKRYELDDSYAYSLSDLVREIPIDKFDEILNYASELIERNKDKTKSFRQSVGIAVMGLSMMAMDYVVSSYFYHPDYFISKLVSTCGIAATSLLVPSNFYGNVDPKKAIKRIREIRDFHRVFKLKQ